MEPKNSPEANQPQINSSNDTNLAPPAPAKQPEGPGLAITASSTGQTQEPSLVATEQSKEPISTATTPSAEQSENQSSNSSEAPSTNQSNNQPADQPNNQPTSQSEKPAKKPLPKNQKIMLIVAIIILLIALGIGIWYFFFNPTNAPQNGQSGATPEAPTTSELALKDSELSDFDLKFLKLNNNSENIIYSPLSIKYALAMLAEASADESKTQITNILGDYQPKTYPNNANRSFANAMFVRTGSEFSNLLKNSYTDTIKTKYNAEIIPDSFASPDNANNWVSKETLGIINNMFDSNNFNQNSDFVLLNALAIDMNWNNQLQCARGSKVHCEQYHFGYMHENYFGDIKYIDGSGFSSFDKVNFNNSEVPAAEIEASANRYDIIKELGEEHIRQVVQAEFEKWLNEGNKDDIYNPFNLDTYMSELASNYERLDESTDFSFYDSENERVFAKDLQQYDGSTLQYIGIMPKNASLTDYITNISAESINNLIGSLKKSSDIYSYKEGVVTRVHAYIPFFKYNYEMKEFENNLTNLGIKDVFSEELANLSGMITTEEATRNPYIKKALHKADINFSNDGIKAAAATGFAGGMGAGGSFDYRWDVPVEEIDLTFDKPFVFIIKDKTSGEVWFTGAVYNPVQ